MLYRMKSCRWVAVSAALLVAGCGGGGVGAASSPSGQFTLSTASLTFVARTNQPAPPSQTIAVHVSSGGAYYVVAGWPTGSPVPGWVKVMVNAVDSSDANVVVSITGTAEPPGNYTATLVLATTASSNQPLNQQNVQIAYKVENGIGLSTTSGPPSMYPQAPPQSLQLDVTNPGNAAFTLSSSAPWLTVPTGMQAPATGQVAARIDPSGLAPGTHTATVTATDATDPTDVASLAISLLVLPPAVTLSSSASQVTAYVGEPAQSVQIDASNPIGVTYTLASSAPWLTVPGGNQTGSSLQLRALVDAASLSPGTYSATVTATDLSNPGDVSSLAVRLTVLAPTVGVSPGAVTFGGADGTGTDDSVAATLALGPYSSAATAATWTATVVSQTGGSWLAITSGSGTLGPTRLTGTFSLVADRSALQAGSYGATVDVAVTIEGQTFHQTVPVTLNRSAERLLVSSYGVAFSKFPSSSLLTRTLGAFDTDGTTTVPWTATSSDPTWLTVTPSGTTGANGAAGNLVLTANPAGLATDQEHIATVTVATTDGVIKNQETIRVGLWVGSADPQPTSANLSAVTFPSVTTDPVEPYAFVSEGGTDVQVYNVYTGALITTYAGVGQALGPMAVSSDGSTLYVEDVSNPDIVPITIESGAIGTPYALPPGGFRDKDMLAYGKVADEPLLLSGSGTEFDLATGKTYQGLTGPSVAISPNGYIGLLNTNISPSTLYIYRASFSSLTSDVAFARTGTTSPGFDGLDLAATVDGSGNDLFAVADHAAPSFYEISTGGQLKQSFSTQASSWPDNIAVGWNGTVVGGTALAGTSDIAAYSPDGTVLGTLYAAPAGWELEDRSVRLSGDATQMTAVTYNPSVAGQYQLDFIPVP